MSLIVATLRELANALRCAPSQAEEVVRDERSARASFDRRGFFRAAGAVATGALFSVPTPRAKYYRTFSVFIGGKKVGAAAMAWSLVPAGGITVVKPAVVSVAFDWKGEAL